MCVFLYVCYSSAAASQTVFPTYKSVSISVGFRDDQVKHGWRVKFLCTTNQDKQFTEQVGNPIDLIGRQAWESRSIRVGSFYEENRRQGRKENT